MLKKCNGCCWLRLVTFKKCRATIEYSHHIQSHDGKKPRSGRYQATRVMVGVSQGRGTDQTPKAWRSEFSGNAREWSDHTGKESKPDVRIDVRKRNYRLSQMNGYIYMVGSPMGGWLHRVPRHRRGVVASHFLESMTPCSDGLSVVLHKSSDHVDGSRPFETMLAWYY
jgi:hypothetical protein